MPRKRKLDVNDESDESSAEDSSDEKLSDYELVRLRNIEERKKLMRTLGIESAKKELAEVTPTRKGPSTTPAKKSTPKVIRVKEPLPRREPSRRLRKLRADGEAASIRIAYEELEEEEDELDRRLLGTMPMAVEDEESASLLKRLAAISSSGVATSDPTVSLGKCDLLEFQKNLMGFRLTYEERLFYKRIQSLIVHPTTEKKLAISGSTDGQIGIWDLDLELSATFKTHHSPVNCLSVSSFDPSKLFSTSHDGVFACGDLEKSVFSNVYATSFEDRVNHLTWHDQLDEHQFLLAHGNGSVGLIDAREAAKEKSEWYPCFERSARTVQIHPIERSYFLVSSGAGYSCKIFDLRTLGKRSPCEPVVEMKHSKGLTSAFFSPSGDQVLTTCNDNLVRLFTSGIVEKHVLKKSIPHNNHTGRWLSVFKAMWFPGREDVFFIGSLLSPRRIQMYGTDGQLVFELKDEDLTTVTSLIAAHPALPLIVGGNSTGRLYAFSPPTQETS